MNLDKITDRQYALADILYTTYCKAVGGKAFNGEPLPDWDTFVNDDNKETQAEGWLQVAAVALDELKGSKE